MMHIFDSHFHIIDHGFPVVENNGYMPPNYTVEDYKIEKEKLSIKGGAIVSGSFQQFDQTYLIDVLEKLGPTFCGVTQLPATVSDDEILGLHEKGVKAIRFNVTRGGSETLEQLDYFARRVYDLVGWHSELYMDAKDLPHISPIIEQLPAVSIDHLGLSEEGLPHLLSLVSKGIQVKATGFGRVELDVPKALRRIYCENNDALMFGTDLPSTRAKRPFQYKDVELIRELFSEKDARKILYENALAWYRL